MPINATVTGKVGAGASVTSLLYSNVSTMSLDSNKELLTFFMADGTIKDIDVSAATTWTFTVIGNNYTLTVS